METFPPETYRPTVTKAKNLVVGDIYKDYYIIKSIYKYNNTVVIYTVDPDLGEKWNFTHKYEDTVHILRFRLSSILKIL